MNGKGRKPYAETIHGRVHLTLRKLENAMRRMGAGSVVGEMEVLDPRSRSATVTAVTPVHALRLDKAAFDEALRMSPEIAQGVIVELVRRLRETHQPRPGP